MPVKIFSWNVNGLRAVIRKNALQPFLSAHDPDILCLQETKANKSQVELDLKEYAEFWHSAERPGYSGTAIFTKTSPISVSQTFLNPIPDFTDNYGNTLAEGRILTAEFPNFYLVNVYTPNSKPDLSRLKLREKFWDPLFLRHLLALEQKKPVIACGDFNAAHTEIDLARPKQNTKNAGFTLPERQGITNLTDHFLDTFRLLHPHDKRYTWWSHWGQARANNVGWRIDYFFLSPKLKSKLLSADIHESVLGSDHCPISIHLKV